MRIAYKNSQLEKIVTIVKAVTSAIVVASFVILFGFDEPVVPLTVLLNLQLGLLCLFLSGKTVRLFNAVSRREYVVANWFEIPILVALAAAILGSGRWSDEVSPERVRHLAVGIYLIIEVIVKMCMASVNLAASGRNPTKTLVASFLVLIVAGGGLLMLPRASL